MKRSNPLHSSALNLLSSLLFLFFGSIATAQVLDWSYEDVLTDTQQSGANPDMLISTNGDIHITYWQKRQERLVYARRSKASGLWTYETIHMSGSYGFKSALALDSNGHAHVCFLAQETEQAFLFYATNISGSWETEAVYPGVSLGQYGEGNTFPRFVEHSLDIVIQPNDKPIILFFNGQINNVIPCTDGGVEQVYNVYELNLNTVIQESDDTWTYMSIPDLDFNGGYACFAGSDRLGEFCQIFREPDGSYRIMANALHNSKVIWMKSDTNNFSNWTFYTVDSLKRAFNQNPSSIQFYQGFDALDISRSGDSIVHMTYMTSKLYGWQPTSDNRKLFFYTRYHPDSLGSPTYSPDYREIGNRDGYKNGLSIVVPHPDSVFIAYYYTPTSTVLMAESVNAGLNWTFDTIMVTLIGSPLKMEAYGDSLYLLSYHEDKDYLSLSKRAKSGGDWVQEFATITEERATTLSSIVERNGGDDEIHIAFNEALSGQLYYGHRLNGNWTFEGLEEMAVRAEDVSIHRMDNGVLNIAYVDQQTESLKLATQNGASWTIQTVDESTEARDIQLTSFNSKPHIICYDIKTGDLKHIWANNTSGPWTVDLVDDASNIIGQRPDVVVAPDGTLHVSYVDVFNASLKHAELPPGGTWTLEQVTVPLNYSPTFNSIDIRDDGNLVIAFRDASTNTIHVAEDTAGIGWDISNVAGDFTNLVGTPLKLLLDGKNRPWILYNYATVIDELRLVRRDKDGEWQQVSVLNNSAQVSQVFDFHLVDNDFYVVGKKNQLDNHGIGVLYAAEGVQTPISADLQASDILIHPNPAHEMVQLSFQTNRNSSLSIEVYNLQGQKIHTVLNEGILPLGNHQYNWSVHGWPEGLYVCVLYGQGMRLQKKLLVMP